MSFNVLHKLSCNGSTPKCVTFSRDGKLIAAGDYNGSIRIWYTNSGSLLNRIRTSWLLGVRGSQWPAITSLAFSPDGTTIISTTDNLVDIFFWSVETGVLLRTLTTGFNMSNVFFTPDGTNIISAYNFGYSNIDIWNVGTGTKQTILTDRYSSLQLSSDGKTIVQAGAGSQLYAQGLPDYGKNFIKLIDLETGATITAVEDTSPVTNAAIPVTNAAISPDKQTILSTNLLGEFKAWVNGRPTPLKPDGYYGNKAIFTTDGNGFVSCGDSSVTLWDTTRMVPIQTLKAPINQYGRFETFSDIDITRDDSKIALACSDQNVYILTKLGVNALRTTDILTRPAVDGAALADNYLPDEVIGEIAQFVGPVDPTTLSEHYKKEGPFKNTGSGKRKSRRGRKNKSKIKRKQTKKNKK